METLLLLDTQNNLNTGNCCGNTDLCLCLGIWSFSLCHEAPYSVLRFDVLLGCFSLLSLRLCFMADWFMVLSISSDFLHLTHLSFAEISFFCSVADQFSLQFATAYKGWLLPVLQCLLLDYKTNKQEKRQLRSTTVETWRYFWMFIHSLIPWIQCRRKINPMKSLQHIPLCDGVLGELLLCLICDRYPSGRHRNALWRGMV